MCRRIYLFFLALTLSANCFSQRNPFKAKESFLTTRAGLFFGHTDVPNDGLNPSIQAEGGYFISQKLAPVAQILVGMQGSQEDNYSRKYSCTFYNASLGVQWYPLKHAWKRNHSVQPYGSIAFGFVLSDFCAERTSEQLIKEGEAWGCSVNFQAGALFQLNKVTYLDMSALMIRTNSDLMDGISSSCAANLYNDSFSSLSIGLRRYF